MASLPCVYCQTHAYEYAHQHPPDFETSARYQTWAWRFHNAVNKRLGAPLMSADGYRQTYAEELAQQYAREGLGAV
mgnify:CR=1 FL=1